LKEKVRPKGKNEKASSFREAGQGMTCAIAPEAEGKKGITDAWGELKLS